MNWYVVHTQPHKEEYATQNLQDQGFETYLPRFAKKRTHARKIETVHVPLFPRYAFVSFDETNTQWRAINGTRGVIALLSQDNTPVPVGAGIVDALKVRENEKGLLNLSALTLFTPGETVHIIDGPFTGHEAVFDGLSDGDRGRVLINFMQRDMSVNISLQDIKAA